MQDLLYQSNGMHDLTMNAYYVSNYLVVVTKATYDKIVVSPVSLASMSLVEIH
jgi:hypothetical protein